MQPDLWHLYTLMFQSRLYEEAVLQLLMKTTAISAFPGNLQPLSLRLVLIVAMHVFVLKTQYPMRVFWKIKHCPAQRI